MMLPVTAVYVLLSIKVQTGALQSLCSAASIWFEIWGSRGPGSKNFDSFRQFHKQEIDLSGKIFEKFLFFQVISPKISIFQVRFPKNFDFCRQFPKIFRFSREIFEKFRFFQAISQKIDFSGHI